MVVVLDSNDAVCLPCDRDLRTEFLKLGHDIVFGGDCVPVPDESLGDWFPIPAEKPATVMRCAQPMGTPCAKLPPQLTREPAYVRQYPWCYGISRHDHSWRQCAGMPVVPLSTSRLDPEPGSNPHAWLRWSSQQQDLAKLGTPGCQSYPLRASMHHGPRYRYLNAGTMMGRASAIQYYCTRHYLRSGRHHDVELRDQRCAALSIVGLGQGLVPVCHNDSGPGPDLGLGLALTMALVPSLDLVQS